MQNDGIALQQQIKILTIQYEIARKLQHSNLSVQEMINTILLKSSQIFEEFSGIKSTPSPFASPVRIKYDNQIFSTPNFTPTPYSLKTSLETTQGRSIEIEIFSIRELSSCALKNSLTLGPTSLLESIAEMLSSYLIHRETNQDLEKKIVERTEQLRSLAAELSLAEERQRRAIASDLHDHVGQALTLIKFKLQELQGNNVFGPFYETLGEIKSLVEQTVAYTRSLTVELGPPILYELGLESAIEWLANQIKKKHQKIKVTVKSDKQPKPLTDDSKVSLFRFVNELLQNVLKHAHATYILIEIIRENNKIKICVNDNGCGFDPFTSTDITKTKSFGLFGLRERLSYMGGALKIESRPGAGTRAIISANLASGD